MKPPCASIAARNTSSWAASATRMASASASHRRVEPSTSVNKNVTTPDGRPALSADTQEESHNRHGPTSYIGGSDPVTEHTPYETNFRESQGRLHCFPMF
jgi:hypothetical protein